ncbi:hypothetical protein [Candidatus Protofrankia californiensis]|uniref:hypothetical protein n=1 Tax=Candidatus Protofrankia californiensis TaxID=1839754 RepID=UPI0010419D44|nr:hypothetical protein [Candidatus Protofrankia californiensis]
MHEVELTVPAGRTGCSCRVACGPVTDRGTFRVVRRIDREGLSVPAGAMPIPDTRPVLGTLVSSPGRVGRPPGILTMTTPGTETMRRWVHGNRSIRGCGPPPCTGDGAVQS